LLGIDFLYRRDEVEKLAMMHVCSVTCCFVCCVIDVYFAYTWELFIACIYTFFARNTLYSMYQKTVHTSYRDESWFTSRLLL
jgi:hypothetical protein